MVDGSSYILRAFSEALQSVLNPITETTFLRNIEATTEVVNPKTL